MVGRQAASQLHLASSTAAENAYAMEQPSCPHNIGMGAMKASPHSSPFFSKILFSSMPPHAPFHISAPWGLPKYTTNIDAQLTPDRLPVTEGRAAHGELPFFFFNYSFIYF